MFFTLELDCFNRTFMELKYKRVGFLISDNWFQSYLYGIEIWWLSSSWDNFSLFQSYLYGIEIIASIFSDICSTVSIVPLWNWNISVMQYQKIITICFNRTFMELKWRKRDVYLPASLFQSYLYGIEMIVIVTNIKSSVCFNRTFMELKWTYRTPPRNRRRFQSYLYGIEIE